MHFNILHHLFQAKVDSDAVTSDGYEVTNLISPNFRERSKGFLSSNFVNPPVQILFQLPFAVNLEKVMIIPKVGSQISSGFEILAAGVQHERHKTDFKFVSSSGGIKRKSTSVHATKKKRIHVSSKQAVKRSNMETNTEESSTVSNPYPSVDCESSIHAYECEITCVSAKTEHRSHFVSVAHVFTDAGTPFMICNNRFCERQPRQSVNWESIKPCKDVFNFRNMHKLQVVTHLIVRIIKTVGSSVPALKNIEIWGQPVWNCPQETINIITLIQKQIEEGNKIHDHQIGKPVRLSKNNVSHTIDMSSVDIPQEFIDPITCSIMTIPILLPSGHNVDSTTLEKHVECERGWGRAASDPFTGINFSENYRPLPNSSLKVRIDRFLLLSNLNVQNLGRTVGRDTSTINTDHSFNIQKNGYKLNAPTLQGPKGSADKCHKTLLHADNIVVVTKADSGKKSDNYKLGTKARSFCVEHESEVSQSLDVALTNALQGMQTFTRLAEPLALASKPNNSQAVESQTFDASTSTLVNTMPLQTKSRRVRNYSTLTALQDSSKMKVETCPGCKKNMQDQVKFCLPCKHILCRPCLLTNGKDKILSCIVCKQQFLRKDVVRVYTA